MASRDDLDREGNPGIDRPVYDQHILRQDSGVNTPAQYQRFKNPVYSSFKRGFPRRYVDITPTENLFDDKILGRDIRARLIGTGETMLHQPRVETEAMTQLTRTDCPPPTMPFECPPPFSQLPVIKKQIHLEPSRDAEIFRAFGCGDVPASVDGVVPGTLTLFSFDTFNTLRTLIKWTQMIVYDALCPSLVTAQFNVDGSTEKWMAVPNGSTVGSSGNTYGTVTSAMAQDFQCLPEFENTLFEITDRKHVDVVISNLAMVDRKVDLCLWGWIESITAWDNAVRR